MLILSFTQIRQTSHPGKNPIDIRPLFKGNNKRMGTFRGKMRGAEMLHIRNIHNVSASHGRDLIFHTAFWRCHIVSEIRDILPAFLNSIFIHVPGFIYPENVELHRRCIVK